MFENEILNKNTVELYDNDLDLLTQGVITKYQAKLGYIVVDYKFIYSIRHIAKIAVVTKNNIVQHRSAHL